MDKSIFKRHELKYLVSAEQREFIESKFARYMIPDEHGESTICNIYYDTPDFRLIRRSLEKPVYKEKLRLRSYGTASKDEKVFLELKKKYKGIVYKRRISLNCDDEPYGEQILDRGYSLMEIKAAGSMPLWLAELLAQGGIKQTSFSKYGMAYMTMLRRSMGIRTKKVKSEVTVNV